MLLKLEQLIAQTKAAHFQLLCSMVKILFERADFLDNATSNNCSWIWRKVLQLRPPAENFENKVLVIEQSFLMVQPLMGSSGQLNSYIYYCSPKAWNQCNGK